MHVAPPVRLTLAPDAAWQGFVGLVAALAGANVGAWAALHFDGAAPAVIAAALCGAAACLLSVGRRQRAEAGVLAWDGSVWSWQGGGAVAQPGRLRVMLDLGAWMLLRLAPTGLAWRAHWLVASRRQAQGAWSSWRTALVSRPAVEPIDPLAPT